MIKFKEFPLSAICFILLSTMIGSTFAQENDSLAQTLIAKAKLTDNKESLPFIERGFELCKNNACADSTIGKLYQRKSVAYYRDFIDDDLAISFSDSAILFYEKAYNQDNILIANSYFNKGTMQRVIGRLSEGRKDIETALVKLQGIDDGISRLQRDSIMVNWSFALLRICSKLGDYKTALELGAFILNTDNIRQKSLYSLHNQIGIIYSDKADYVNAKKNFLKALDSNEKSDMSVIGNLGLVYLRISDIANAETYLLSTYHYRIENLVQNSSNRNKRFLSNSHANLLQLYLQKKDWERAEYHYSEALRLLLEVDSTGSLPRFAEIYFKKAKLEHALGRYESSMEFLDKAMQVVAPELTQTGTEENITIIGPFKRVLEIIGFRAEVLASQGQLEAALVDVALLNRLVTQSRRTYQSSLSKYYLIQQVMPVYELGIQLNQQLFAQTRERRYLEQAYALNARNKAILLLESLQSDRAMTFAGLPLSVQEEEKELRDALTEQERILYAAYQNDKAIDSLQSVVFEREQAYYQFVQQLEKDYPAYYELKYSADSPPKVEDVQARLDKDQALVEYFMGQDSIYTFLLDGHDLKVYSKAKPAGLVDSIELIRELLANGIEKDCEQSYISLAHYFYNLLLAEPLIALPQDQNRLVIIPDGLLNFLSFEALLYKDLDKLQGAEGYLLEKYALSYAYSSKLLLEEAYYPRSATKGFVGFGMEYDEHTLEYLQEFDPNKWEEVDSTFTLPCGQLKDTTRYWGKLTYSDDEVRTIAELTAGDSWLNEAVTKENFLQNADGYNLLHLAMHGTYDLEFPMNSSLIFTRTDSSDVFLRAAEIYGMELSGDMVVLSACNTAYGKLQAGEGPMTLARAFHYAGIPSVVASLWSIPDNSTSKIMTLFYEQLDRGLSKDVALQQAKLMYLQDDEISSPSSRQPLHWASTIIIGDAEPVPISPRHFWWWLVGGIAALGAFFVWSRRRSMAS